MQHYDIKIFGKVQGIGFRFMAMEAAYKYHVRGFVQNLKDGSVYLEVEGKEEDLKRFLEWCNTGALGAKVERIEATEGHLKNFVSFDIKRSSESQFEKYL